VVVGGAHFSPDRQYRYVLWRRWGKPVRVESTVLFVMLNPSIADADRLDPTVTRCVGFARSWGFNRLYVGNACALVSTDPRALAVDPDPVGNPENDKAIRTMARRSRLVVVAWGTHLSHTRAQTVLRVIRDAGRTPHALAVTKSGAPGHPLYLPASRRPEPYA
jgi:hypothetical protein